MQRGGSCRRLRAGSRNHLGPPSRTATPAPAARRRRAAYSRRSIIGQRRSRVRLGKARTVQRGPEPLSLAAAHSHTRRAYLNEPGPGGCGLPYELVRDAAGGQQSSDESRASEPSRANSGELERITALLFEALRASGYLQLEASASAEEKLRRLVRRLSLSAEDAEIWQGMLRQIIWKMRSGRDPSR